MIEIFRTEADTAPPNYLPSILIATVESFGLAMQIIDDFASNDESIGNAYYRMTAIDQVVPMIFIDITFFKPNPR